MRHYVFGLLNSFGWNGIIMGILFILLIGIITFFILKAANRPRLDSKLTNETFFSVLKTINAKAEAGK